MKDITIRHLSECTTAALTWMVFGAWFATEWFTDISTRYGDSWAANLFSGYIILFIALIPGFIQVFHYTAVMFHNRFEPEESLEQPPVTVLVAAYNEEVGIVRTVQSIIDQIYDGHIQILVMNDGSTDNTLQELNKLFEISYSNEIRILQPNSSPPKYKSIVNRSLKIFTKNRGGKAAALNDLMKIPGQDLVITVDGDCQLHPQAIKHLVAKKLATGYAAIAGTVFVLNQKDSIWSRIQYWEYCLGIYHVKKVQGYFGCTSVCQGAFSIYDRSAIDAVGGWKETVGEDIVLSWDMLANSMQTGHCDTALCFTTVPTTAKTLMKQRARWARGMIEAIKSSPQIAKPNKRFTVFNWMILTFPIIDFTYIFVLLPSLLFAITLGDTLIVGSLFYLVVATGFTLNLTNYKAYSDTMKNLSLETKPDFLGFIAYSTVYGFYIQACSLLGYWNELREPSTKNWGTK